MADMSCPSCTRIDWVQSVPALRATGVSTVSGVDHYSGVGLTSTGLVPVMGTAVVERTTTSMLARVTSPGPPRVRIRWPLMLGLVLLMPAVICVVAMVIGVVQHPRASSPSVLETVVAIVIGAWFVVSLAAPAVVAFTIVVRRSRRNDRVLRGRGAAYAAWSGGCYCHRCGVCFWPVSPAPGVVARYVFSPEEFRWVVWNIGGYGDCFGPG
ncbi:hypothetical protein BJY24_005681 [Nocardia transvalensis]|uniref:Uncharacterized protein n=1 Tax=Nocardia transvalensis TaxID=37333 RepID=A0A7W9PJJ5_9NOCA|nr:hypothetical protein [Nocardia transvalensis]MBB5916769.1 hypothetical protein [Nocardia transvalensis]